MSTVAISDEVLTDAALDRKTLAVVKQELMGSDREALAHWHVISERLRNYYRDAAHVERLHESVNNQ
jgi:hypothetical protein